MPKLVLCLGDSHTKGQYGTDWLGRAQAAWGPRGLQFVRSGVNGNISLSMAKRLPQELQRHPKPDGFVLLAGSNDVMASTRSDFRWFHQHVTRQLTGSWSRQQYIGSVTKSLDDLAQASPGCQVAVLTVPPLGEQLDSPMNQQVVAFNSALAQAVAHRPNTTLIDFHKACINHLAAAARGQVPPAFDHAIWRLVFDAPLALLQRYVLRWSWDAVGRWRGLRLLTDFIHLNDTAGELLLRELEPWLEQLAAAPAGQHSMAPTT